MEREIDYSAFADLIEELFSKESFEPLIWANNGVEDSMSVGYIVVNFFVKNYENVAKSMQSLCNMLRSNLPEKEFNDTLINHLNSPVWPIAEKLFDCRDTWLMTWYDGRKNEIMYPTSKQPNSLSKEEELETLFKKFVYLLNQKAKVADLTRENNCPKVDSNPIRGVEGFLRESVGLEKDMFFADFNKSNSL